MTKQVSGYDDRIVTFEDVELAEFIQESTKEYGSYIRMYVDRQNSELRFYHFGSEEERDIRMTLEGVRMRHYGPNVDMPEKIHFHSTDAETLLSWLNALKAERANRTLSFKYYDENDSTMIERAGLHTETIRIVYETSTDRRNVMHINNVYQDEAQMMADWR